MKNLTFERMPQAMVYIMQKLEDLEKKVDFVISTSTAEPVDKWFNVDDLCRYLPQQPARQTVYGWTSSNQIPYHKNGKSILFRKSEIDAWLIGGAVKSHSELGAEAQSYVSSKKGGIG